jgi:hypothetical protein
MAKFDNLTPAELLSRIGVHPAESIRRQLRVLQVTGRILTMNAQELITALTDLNSHPVMLSLWSAENRELFHEYHGEIVRHFHNFLASAKTLVDHGRRYVNKNYADSAFLDEYRKQVDARFSHSALVAFVHDLRNFMLHRGLPETSARLAVNHPRDGGGAESTIRLQIGELRQWGQWSKLGRRQLEEYTTDPDLLAIARSYLEVLEEFYAWLNLRLQEVHFQEFSELESLYEALNRVRSEPPGGSVA